MHLVSTVVGKYEIPLLPIITPANVNDSPIMIPLLRKTNYRLIAYRINSFWATKGMTPVRITEQL